MLLRDVRDAAADAQKSPPRRRRPLQNLLSELLMLELSHEDIERSLPRSIRSRKAQAVNRRPSNSQFQNGEKSSCTGDEACRVATVIWA
jgi:hypothetical protein